MKKLGICICYQQKNYGSQLQCYATAWELKRRNIDYEIIRYAKEYTPRMILRQLPRLFNPVWVSERILLRYPKKLILVLCPSFRKKNDLRNGRIAEFSKKNFTSVSPLFKGYDALREGSKNYAAVLVGSDQLWAPSGIQTGFYNLMFAADGIPRLSYAASMGVSRVNQNLRVVYQAFLSQMTFISMREKRGQELVKELSGREAEWVVDPVLLLDAAQWNREIPDREICDAPYIFAYFLGRSREYHRQVSAYAHEKGLKIVTMHHVDSVNPSEFGFGDEILYDVGPEEFVNLIRHAVYIFTDSFHGAVFSLIYRKPFLVFDRYATKSVSSKNSRIESLCEGFGIFERRYRGDIHAVDLPMDYDAVHAKISEQRARSIRYLDRALAVMEESKE